MVSVAA